MDISQLLPFIKENEKNIKIHCAIGNAEKGKCPRYLLTKK